MSTNLPPLPRCSERSVDSAFWGGERLYTAEEMRAYALLALKSAEGANTVPSKPTPDGGENVKAG